MSFKNIDMSVIAYANGWTLWHYRTQDELALVLNTDYFPKKIIDLMAVGDVIYVTSKGKTSQLQVLKIENGKCLLGNLS